MTIKTFRKGGIHPAENKITAGKPIQNLPLPDELIIMTSQCIGAPSVPVVKTGDIVKRGDKIADAGGFIGAPIHSPVNGTVKKIEPVRTPQGLWQTAIIIQPDADNPLKADYKPRPSEEVARLSAEEIINITGDFGIVGLGGATFPTKVKMTPPKGKSIDTVLINGAECEPYLTCDDALMNEYAKEIVEGSILIKKATGAKRIIIGIEDNKKSAINKIKEASRPYPEISVEILKKKYPQGSEKQLIQALTGRVVMAGGLPADCGCIVDNVATAYALYDAVYNRQPLIERIVTVTGKYVASPGNFRVLNGTPISYLIEAAGGFPENTGKLIAGGPMMGRAVSNLTSGATKGLSGLVIMEESESVRKKARPCIRCSACINVCPMGLEPYLFMQQAQNSYWEDMKKHGVMNCIECGSCSYTCPASRPLVDMIKLGKSELRKK